MPGALVGVVVVARVILVGVVRQRAEDGRADQHAGGDLGVVVVIIVAIITVAAAVDPERGPAAIIHPDLAAVVVPGAALPAVRTGQLAVQGDVAGAGQGAGLIAVVAALAGDEIIRTRVLERKQQQQGRGQQRTKKHDVDSGREKKRVSLTPTMGTRA